MANIDDTKIPVGGIEFPIMGRMHDVSKDHVVAGANELFDDDKRKRQSAINREVDNHFEEQEIKINNRYTKEETNNLISRTPETDVIVIEIPAASQSNIAAWLDANTPSGIDPETGRSVRANKIYRVPGPGNHSYSEWAWDGTAYVMLANKDYGIDRKVIFGSENTVTGDAVAKSDIRNIFYCINTKDKNVCYCDKDYTVDTDNIITAEDEVDVTNIFIFYCINTREDRICYYDKNYTVDADDIISLRGFPDNISVVNAKNAILGCNENFSVDANVVENDVSNPFFNAIKDRYTIDEDNEMFLGFPMCIVYDNVIYVFYRRAIGHVSTPGVENDFICYQWSEDGVNWSDRQAIEFRKYTESKNPPFDYRGIYPFEQDGNLYCVLQIAPSYKDEHDEWYIGGYIAGAAKLIKNADNTLTVESEELFPSFDIRDGSINFNKHYGDEGYIGTVVGGMVILKDGYVYIPVYYFDTYTGVLKWEINTALDFNEDNFSVVATINGGSSWLNEATLWFDTNDILKTLVRLEKPSCSKIYSIDEETEEYTELSTVGNCQGPTSIQIDNDKVLIAGRGYSTYSNIILWDDVHNKVLSYGNEYDTPGFNLITWTDSFYGCFCKFKQLYYHFFYKTLSENVTSINYVTFNTIGINNINNYNKGKNIMGTLVKNNNIVNDGNLKFSVPCCAAINYTKRINLYQPEFHNPNAPSLKGIISAVLGMTINLGSDINSYLKFSIKNESEGILLLIENHVEAEGATILISYINGIYKYQIKKFLATIAGSYVINPCVVVNTINNRVQGGMLYIDDNHGGVWGSEIVENPEIDIDDYPNGIHITYNNNTRISMTGASVNNVPLFSYVNSDADGKNIDLVSKIPIRGGFIATDNDLQNIPYLNDWFLTAMDAVQD